MALDCCASFTSLFQLQDTDLTDRVSSALNRVYREIIDAEASKMSWAQPHERTGERTTYRNEAKTAACGLSGGPSQFSRSKTAAGVFLSGFVTAAQTGR